MRLNKLTCKGAGIMVMAALSNPAAKRTANIFADIVANDTAILDALEGANVSADPSECIPYESASSSSSPSLHA